MTKLRPHLLSEAELRAVERTAIVALQDLKTATGFPAQQVVALLISELRSHQRSILRRGGERE